MEQQIIGLGHKKRTGKDLFAKYLKKHLNEKGLTVELKSFADPIKNFCSDLYKPYGMKSALFYEENPEKRKEKLKTISKTPRELWIETGGAIRGIYEDIWIDYLFENIEADVLIVTDVRFPKEAKKIEQALNGLLIKIERDLGDSEESDSADKALDDYEGWNDIIENNRTEKDLELEAEVLAKTIQETHKEAKENEIRND